MSKITLSLSWQYRLIKVEARLFARLTSLVIGQESTFDVMTTAMCARLLRVSNPICQFFCVVNFLFLNFGNFSKTTLFFCWEDRCFLAGEFFASSFQFDNFDLIGILSTISAKISNWYQKDFLYFSELT